MILPRPDTAYNPAGEYFEAGTLLATSSAIMSVMSVMA